MKFSIGQWNIGVNFYALSKLRLEVTIDTDQPTIKASVFISYFADYENPLVIKGEIKTEDGSHAKEGA